MNGGDLVIWRDDDVSGGEGTINPEELVYIETDNNRIRMMNFLNCPSWLQTYEVSLVWFQDSSLKTTFMDNCDEEYVVLVPECSNVQFQFDDSPPLSKYVNVSFEITENDRIREYHVDSALRCWAGHLLDSAGTSLISDDD